MGHDTFETMDDVAGVDLNLLVVLQALLEERSAARAARRLNVPQPAVLQALQQLQGAFGDALLERNGRGLSPTPRGAALKPQLDALVEQVARVFEVPEVFEPHTTQREFSLACSDHYSLILVPALSALLRERAPGASLRVRSLDELAEHGLERDLDVHIGVPPSIPSGCLSSVLFEDRFVCLVKPGSLAQSRVKPGARRLSLADFLAAPHVSVLGRARDPVDMLLEARGVTRSVALVVPSFSVVPFVVHDTGLVATLSRRLALVHARHLSLELLEPPIELGEYGVQMIWHQRSDADDGARFFRGLLEEVVGAAPATPSARRRKK